MLSIQYLPIIFMILVYGSLFCLLIYFIIKRIDAKKKEDFEKRNN